MNYDVRNTYTLILQLPNLVMRSDQARESSLSLSLSLSLFLSLFLGMAQVRPDISVCFAGVSTLIFTFTSLSLSNLDGRRNVARFFLFFLFFFFFFSFSIDGRPVEGTRAN